MASGRFHDFPRDGGPKLPPVLDAPIARSSAGSSADLELRIANLERERVELRAELFEAAQVQRRLSGPRHLDRHGFEIASETFPVRCLAGDFVCTMDIADRTWIALGDIGGKGLAAAMWFTHLASLIRCHAAALGDVAGVMRELNADLCSLQPGPPLTSMVLFVLSGDKGCAEYCNAGHPAPMLVRAGCPAVEQLETGGPLLGVIRGAAYHAGRFRLGACDLLLGCTDGVLECSNDQGEEFGHDRLLQVARDHAADPAQALLFSVLGRVQDFAAATPRADDISLLLIRAAGNATAQG